jgi:hypothetical protein
VNKYFFRSLSRIFFLAFLVLLISNNGLPLPLDYIKKTWTLFKKEYAHLSPIFGAIIWETRIIEKYFLLCSDNPKENDNTEKLIKEHLFHVVQGSFSITRNKSYPAAHFSPELIGKILCYVQNCYMNEKINKNLFVNELKETINSDKRYSASIKNTESEHEKLDTEVTSIEQKQKQFNKILTQSSLTINHVKNTLGNNGFSNFRIVGKKFSEAWNEQLKKFTKFSLLNDFIKMNKVKSAKQDPSSDDNSSIKEDYENFNEDTTIIYTKKKDNTNYAEKINSILIFLDSSIVGAFNPSDFKDINSLELVASLDEDFRHTLEDLKKRRSGVRVDLINDRLKNFLESLFGSLIECGVIKNQDQIIRKEEYYQNFTTPILLTFLYSMAENKNDLKNYFMVLQEKISDIFTEKNFFDNEIWLKDKFICEEEGQNINVKEIVEKTKKYVENNSLNTDFNENFEKIIYAFIKYNFYGQILPKLAQYKTATFSKNAITASFPDCMESTLRNLANIFLFDPTTGRFIIKKNKTSVSKNIIDFYLSATGSQEMYISNIKTHNLWANTMENLPYIAYMNAKNQVSRISSPQGYSGFIFKLNLKEQTRKEQKKKSILLGEENFNVIKIGNKSYIEVDNDSYCLFEIMPTLRNVIIMFNQLFGLNHSDNFDMDFIDENFNTNNFYKMCDNLDWVPYDFDENMLDINDCLKQTQFLMRLKSNENIRFTIMLSPGHGQVNTDAIKENITDNSQFFNKLLGQFDDNNSLLLSGFLNTNKISFDEFKQIKNSKLQLFKQIFLLQPLFDSKIKIDNIKQLMRTNDVNYYNLVKKIIQSISSEDLDSLEQIIVFIKTKFNENSDAFIKSVKTILEEKVIKSKSKNKNGIASAFLDKEWTNSRDGDLKLFLESIFKIVLKSEETISLPLPTITPGGFYHSHPKNIAAIQILTSYYSFLDISSENLQKTQIDSIFNFARDIIENTPRTVMEDIYDNIGDEERKISDCSHQVRRAKNIAGTIIDKLLEKELIKIDKLTSSSTETLTLLVKYINKLPEEKKQVVIEGAKNKIESLDADYKLINELINGNYWLVTNNSIKEHIKKLGTVNRRFSYINYSISVLIDLIKLIDNKDNNTDDNDKKIVLSLALNLRNVFYNIKETLLLYKELLKSTSAKTFIKQSIQKEVFKEILELVAVNLENNKEINDIVTSIWEELIKQKDAMNNAIRRIKESRLLRRNPHERDKEKLNALLRLWKIILKESSVKKIIGHIKSMTEEILDKNDLNEKENIFLKNLFEVVDMLVKDEEGLRAVLKIVEISIHSQRKETRDRAISILKNVFKVKKNWLNKESLQTSCTNIIKEVIEKESQFNRNDILLLVDDIEKWSTQYKKQIIDVETYKTINEIRDPWITFLDKIIVLNEWNKNEITKDRNNNYYYQEKHFGLYDDYLTVFESKQNKNFELEILRNATKEELQKNDFRNDENFKKTVAEIYRIYLQINQKSLFDFAEKILAKIKEKNVLSENIFSISINPKYTKKTFGFIKSKKIFPPVLIDLFKIEGDKQQKNLIISQIIDELNRILQQMQNYQLIYDDALTIQDLSKDNKLSIGQNEKNPVAPTTYHKATDTIYFTQGTTEIKNAYSDIFTKNKYFVKGFEFEYVKIEERRDNQSGSPYSMKNVILKLKDTLQNLVLQFSQPTK